MNPEKNNSQSSAKKPTRNKVLRALRTIQFSVAFPQSLRELIEKNAFPNGRSVNQEIIFQLTKAYELE